MLGTHPRCLATPESKFRFLPLRRRRRVAGPIDLPPTLARIVEHWSYKIWDVQIDPARLLDECTSYPELLLGIVRAYAAKAGRADIDMWIDHTPGNVKYAAVLFDQFPDAKVIHMVRDGRAIAASVMPLDWGPNTVVTAADWWVEFVTLGVDAEAEFGPQRVKRVVYEELVAEPEKTLAETCEFLGLDYRPEMVGGSGFAVPRFTVGQHALVGKRPNPERLSAWKKSLTPRQIEVFESIALEVLTRMGYEPLYGREARRLGPGEKMGLALRELYRRHILNRMRLRRRIHRSVEPGPPDGESGART